MNRRMRNRTYGGVRGRGGNPVPHSMRLLPRAPNVAYAVRRIHEGSSSLYILFVYQLKVVS